MKSLKAGSEAFTKQFKNWDSCLKASKAESVEKLYTNVFEAIKKDPKFTKKAKKTNPIR
jgi:hypothetical protein